MMDDSKTNSDILMQFTEPGGNRAVVLEDDGRVAYAYLLHGDNVVSDVWLYNVEVAPETANWSDRSQLPFLNPKTHCHGEPSKRLTAESIVHCAWSKEGVEIRVDGIFIARLMQGIKPGWSIAAKIDGPLAKSLEAFESETKRYDNQ